MTKAYLEIEDIRCLEDATDNLRDRLLIHMLFHLGCRISEILALEVQYIDYESATVTIKHLKTRTRMTCPECDAKIAKAHAFCPGCGCEVAKAAASSHEFQKMRTLPLDKQTLSLIRDYVDNGGPVSRKDRQVLFGISRHRAWQIVKECADRADLPKLMISESGKLHNVSPHRLRDAFAVHAVKQDDSGDGLRLLQEHLGHASFNTTAKYRKVAGEELRIWYDKLWSEKAQDAG